MNRFPAGYLPTSVEGVRCWRVKEEAEELHTLREYDLYVLRNTDHFVDHLSKVGHADQSQIERWKGDPDVWIYEGVGIHETVCGIVQQWDDGDRSVIGFEAGRCFVEDGCGGLRQRCVVAVVGRIDSKLDEPRRQKV